MDPAACGESPDNACAAPEGSSILQRSSACESMDVDTMVSTSGKRIEQEGSKSGKRKSRPPQRDNGVGVGAVENAAAPTPQACEEHCRWQQI